MEMLFVVIPVAVVLSLLGLIVYAVMRVRAGDRLQISLHGYLAFYVHVAMLAGLIVLSLGLVKVVNAGLSQVGGPEFSYGSRFDGESESFAPTNESDDESKGRQAQHQRDIEREQVRLTNEAPAGFWGGIALAITGGVIYATHLAGRRIAGPTLDRRRIRLPYLGVLLAIFGLVSIISLGGGISGTLDYVFHLSDNNYDGPGGTLAVAIVFTPIWLGLIYTLVKEVRSKT